MLDSARRYELVVRPKGRTPADEYFHNGAVWIEGREGNNYTIDIRNNTPQRALFIVSVDGLDVIEGQPAGPRSQGYVVGAHETISIPGWKISNQEAAEFFFSRNRDSYVNAIGGTTTNTGVIGAMVFSEYIEPAGYQDYYIARSASPVGTTVMGLVTPQVLTGTIGNGIQKALSESTDRRITSSAVQGMAAASNTSAWVQQTACNSIDSSPVTQDVGTGFGQATAWKTHTTQFRRSNPDHPDSVLALYYNTARNLEKMGIRLRRKRDVSYQANPFPGYTTAGCKPPPGWKG